MRLVAGSKRIIAHDYADPLKGEVRWAPSKSLWIGSMTGIGLVLGPFNFTGVAERGRGCPLLARLLAQA